MYSKISPFEICLISSYAVEKRERERQEAKKNGDNDMIFQELTIPCFFFFENHIFYYESKSLIA